MTEQEALDKIPVDWAKDIDPEELEEIAKEIWPSLVFGLAEELGITSSPTDSLDTMITKLAKVHRVSKEKELKTLKHTCMQNSKIDFFTEKYGHLFQQDEYGELSYSQPMLRKITGLAL